MDNSFRQQVALDVLIDSVVPPFRPPKPGSGGRVAVASFLAFLVFVPAIWLVLFSPEGGAIVFVGMVFAGIIGSPVLGYAIYSVFAFRRSDARREQYIGLHRQARDRARRLLTGKASAKYGDSKQKLSEESALLLEMQDPYYGQSGWFFVWREAEAEEPGYGGEWE